MYISPIISGRFFSPRGGRGFGGRRFQGPHPGAPPSQRPRYQYGGSSGGYGGRGFQYIPAPMGYNQAPVAFQGGYGRGSEVGRCTVNPRLETPW